VLEAVAADLEQRGRRVTVVGSDSGTWPHLEPSATVFTMSQGDGALGRLVEYERRGITVINPPAAILGCRRLATFETLHRAGLPQPPTVVVDPTAPILPGWAEIGSVWIKRGDAHAIESGDVTRADDPAVVHRALADLAARGVPRALVQRHIPGVVAKFYAVRGGFFRLFAPTPVGGDVHRAVAAIGQAAAAALGTTVYGGDCVLGTDGTVWLIDLNDWPSYSRCRAEAAAAIADEVSAPRRELGQMPAMSISTEPAHRTPIDQL
jgi:hypothetical protein